MGEGNGRASGPGGDAAAARPPEEACEKRFLTPFLLALLGLGFFAPLVLHPNGTLYSPGSDLIAEHIPAKQFLVRSWRETGELPLWCPNQFAGAPFVHDIQVAVFYPPHWILFLLPPEGVGPALSWLVVAHVIVAGWCMYGFGRWQGLSWAGATAAAFGYMFAGKWMFHLLDAGHYILIGMAWLPLVLLLLEAAIQRAAVVRATAAGAVFALVVLSSHPQWTFYAMLIGALWTLGTALETAGWLSGAGPRTGRRTAMALLRWAGFGAWALLVAGALSAVQWMPTLEAATQASRGAGVQADNLGQEFALQVHQLWGPSPVVGHRWERRAGWSMLWMAAGVLAPVLRGGRVRWWAFVWLMLAALALGGGTLLQQMRFPGFGSLKIHARIWLVAALPAALLVGVTTDALFTNAAAWSRGRRNLCILLFALALLAGVVGLANETAQAVWEGADARFPWYPVTLLVLIPTAFFLAIPRLRSAAPAAGRLETMVWLSVLLLDVWTMSWPLVEVREEKDFYRPSACVSEVMDRRKAAPSTDRWRVLDCCVNGEAGHCALGEGCPLALVYNLETIGGYSPLDVHRFRDYLQFVADDPAPMQPFHGPFGHPVLTSIPVHNKRLVDLLGVRYLLQPRDEDDQPQGHVPAREPAWRRVMEDDHGAAYNFTLGGVQPLPPYEVWENPDALPRAFVAAQAAPLPERPEVLDVLKSADFEQTVLLETWREDYTVQSGGAYRAAEVIDYRPNRVLLHEEGPEGWLVLTDIWFPGWTCTVNGRRTDVVRADFLFRAVRVPAGKCEVVFTFEPESYQRGRELSLGAVALLVVLAAGVVLWRLRNRGAGL